MDIRKKKIKGIFVLSILIIIISLCLAMAIPSVSFSDLSEVAQADAVKAGASSVLNLNEEGVAQDYFSNVITGKQNEYIYFGRNVTSTTANAPGANNDKHTGAIKWRVLSTDSGYSSGNWLLWADYQLGSMSYNFSYTNVNDAYYSTSLIRATLNGGNSYSGSNATKTEILVDNSYLNNIFSDIERLSVTTASSYDTKLWGYQTTSHPNYKTTGIVGNGDGQYTTANISAMNNLAGDSVTISMVGTSSNRGVTETISAGDSLFLLDYYDINNTAYGFGDSGTTYASKVASSAGISWSSSSAGYPGYNDDMSLTSEYLKFSGEIASYYWLRPAGREGLIYADALVVSNRGSVALDAVNTPLGVRPAFNFTPSNIIYATASSVSSNNSTFSSVSTISSSDGKPAYKIYLKTSDYKNYNESANSADAPKISTAGGKITVTKSGQSGSAIILLADKSGNGAVAYQATSSFDSNGVASATLPSGVKASDYNITVLFADNVMGDEYAENIKGSFTYSGLEEPENISVVYNGEVWDSLTNVSAEQKEWYDSSKMEVTFPSNVKDAGTYKVTVTITSDDEFVGTPSEGESEKIRIIDFTIEQKEIAVKISEDNKSISETTGVCSKDLGTERAPTLEISYSKNGVTCDPDVYPTNAGTYVATVKITNDIGKKNYKLKSPYTSEFTIDKREVSKPTISNENRPYKGSNYEIDLANWAPDDVEISVSSGMTYSKEDKKVYAKDAKTYTISYWLKDTDNTKWKGTADDTEPDSLTVVITPATLTVEFHSDAWSWNSGEEKTVYITDNRKSDDDVLTYRVYVGTVQIDASKVAQDSDNKKRTNITIPSQFAGEYKLKVELTNSNYSFTPDEHDFSVADRIVAVNASNIVWKYLNNGVETTLPSWDADTRFEVPYNGKEYRFSASISGVDEDITLTYANQTGTNAGDNYSTTVNLNSSVKLSNTSFTLKWKINKAKYKLSSVVWELYQNEVVSTSDVFNGIYYEIKLSNLPATLSVTYSGNRQRNANSGYTARVTQITNSDPNYEDPKTGDANASTYEYNGGQVFPWTKTWEIKKQGITLSWQSKLETDKNGKIFEYFEVSGEHANKIDTDGYLYYKEDDYSSVSGAIGQPIEFTEIVVQSPIIVSFWVVATLTTDYAINYEITANKEKFFSIGSDKIEVAVELNGGNYTYTYDGNKHGEELTLSDNTLSVNDLLEVKYYKNEDGQEVELDGAPIDSGNYKIILALKSAYQRDYDLVRTQITFEIQKIKITAVWDTSEEIPVLSNLDDALKSIIDYIYCDVEGNPLEDLTSLEEGTYTVTARIKNDYARNYVFVDEGGHVLANVTATEKAFEIEAKEPENPQEPTTPVDPSTPEEPTTPVDPTNPQDPSEPQQSFDLTEFLKENWQPIVTLICIILIIIFMSKGIGYAGKRKKIKKTIEKKYSGAYYAVGGTGLFGLTYTNWTVIACIMLGVTVLAFVFMLLEKRTLNKAEEELEDAKDEYAKNQKEAENKQMQMMLMGMMGGNANGQGFAYQQPALGAEDIRGIVADTMNNMLPNMTQYLPQPTASNNDELMRKLEEQNEENEKRIEKMIKKLAEQQSAEREVASANVNDETLSDLKESIKEMQKQIKNVVNQPATSNETILKVVEKTEHNDETIKQLLKNQETLMEKILELSNNRPTEPQVVEKIVEKEVKVEVPVEVEKVVEKVVEKEVVKEVPIEVEKVVEKIVEIPAAKPAPKAKAPAKRLTLDEAYAKLSDKQKKIFDTLKAYAMSKDKCKEKKSTYFIVLGQSTVNPLVKLTIKKNTTVALFKMEDEYFKDIRRNAGSDGTKVKVKESEVVVGDNQALATAKDMIDLREDQIERYNDYLKEQRSFKKK